MIINTDANRIAKWLRRIAAIICFAALTFWLVAAGSALAVHFEWVAKLQIWAVAVTSSFVMLVFWMAFTLIFGRVYCSTVCPLGTVMDLAARLPRMGCRRFANAYFYNPPRNSLRYGWLAVVALSAVMGSLVLITVFDPSSAYSSIVANLLDVIHCRPLVIGTLSGCAISAAILLLIAVVSVADGRTICNSFCPIGTTLSITARYSLYAIDINTDLCIGCNRCVEVCKAHCINPSDHTVDSSRCVVCFNCLNVCPNKAISYSSSRHRLSKPLMQTSGKAFTCNRPKP